MTWDELADACERADGPSRELDFKIMLLANGKNPDEHRINGQFAHLIPKHITSLDVIVALIAEKLPGQEAQLLNDAMEHVAQNGWRDPHYAQYLCRALCAAFCRAMHHSPDTQEEGPCLTFRRCSTPCLRTTAEPAPGTT